MRQPSSGKLIKHKHCDDRIGKPKVQAYCDYVLAMVLCQSRFDHRRSYALQDAQKTR